MSAAPTAAPIVSVLLTTYRDDWPKLKRAIESIFAQTFQEFEFVIVFEGEDANYQRVVDTFPDPRLVISRQPQGIGRSRCHNVTLSLARGRYMARMDGDDYCYPERLAVELEFFRNNPDIAVLGAGGRLVDEEGRGIGERLFPEHHDEIVRRMAFVNPILHPTVMWDCERTGYDLRYATYHVDDLEVWLQLLGREKRFANLPMCLIDYQQPLGRPKLSWRGVLWVRALHWKLCFRYPRYFLGILIFLLVSATPAFIVNRITRGNRVIDLLRSIRRDNRLTG